MWLTSLNLLAVRLSKFHWQHIALQDCTATRLLTASIVKNSFVQPFPCTHLGRPASIKMSASIIEAPGSFSEGFSTKVLPEAMAIGNIHRGTIAGKLNGQIPATTCKHGLSFFREQITVWRYQQARTRSCARLVSFPQRTGADRTPHNAVVCSITCTQHIHSAGHPLLACFCTW